MSEVRVLKFISGEEIVATVDDGFGLNTVSVSDPLALLPMPNAEGKMTVGISSWAQSVADGEKLEIDKKNILYNAKPNDVLLQKYNMLFGRVVTPPKGIARI
jgi:hypothetical protein